jgi:hypothetical protein
MKTAVEWYSDKLFEILGDNVNLFTLEQTLANHYALKQAKEMEKQQIEDAYSNGRVDEQFKGTGASFYVTKAEQYYNEIFKSE